MSLTTLNFSSRAQRQIQQTFRQLGTKVLISTQKISNWARLRSKKVSIALIVAAVLLPVFWFYVSLTANVGAFDSTYRLDLMAPLTSTRWFYTGKTYVVFAQELPEGLTSSEVEFSLRENVSKSPVSLLSSFKHVELEHNGNIIKSFTRFRVPKSGPYEISAVTPQGELHKLQIRMESPSTEKAQGMTYAFLISAMLLTIVFYVQKPGKISKVGRLMKVQLVGEIKPLPRAFNHLNSRLRIETRQRYLPPSAINATHPIVRRAKNPRV